MLYRQSLEPHSVPDLTSLPHPHVTHVFNFFLGIFTSSSSSSLLRLPSTSPISPSSSTTSTFLNFEPPQIVGSAPNVDATLNPLVAVPNRENRLSL